MNIVVSSSGVFASGRECTEGFNSKRVPSVRRCGPIRFGVASPLFVSATPYPAAASMSPTSDAEAVLAGSIRSITSPCRLPTPYSTKPIVELTDDEARSAFEGRFSGQFNAVRGFGSITLISGLAGQRASPRRGIYVGVLGGIRALPLHSCLRRSTCVYWTYVGHPDINAAGGTQVFDFYWRVGADDDEHYFYAMALDYPGFAMTGNRPSNGAACCRIDLACRCR
jgi:hypothetical protein